MTIDESLGDESSVVVLSLVGDVRGFLDDPRRLLVAMSRARGSLVILADWEKMSADKSRKVYYLSQAQGLMEQMGAFADLDSTASKKIVFSSCETKVHKLEGDDQDAEGPAETIGKNANKYKWRFNRLTRRWEKVVREQIQPVVPLSQQQPQTGVSPGKTASSPEANEVAKPFVKLPGTATASQSSSAPEVNENQVSSQSTSNLQPAPVVKKWQRGVPPIGVAASQRPSSASSRGILLDLFQQFKPADGKLAGSYDDAQIADWRSNENGTTQLDHDAQVAIEKPQQGWGSGEKFEKGIISPVWYDNNEGTSAVKGKIDRLFLSVKKFGVFVVPITLLPSSMFTEQATTSAAQRIPKRITSKLVLIHVLNPAHDGESKFDDDDCWA